MYFLSGCDIRRTLNAEVTTHVWTVTVGQVYLAAGARNMAVLHALQQGGKT